MAAQLIQIVATGANLASLLFPQSSVIGGITVDTTIEEQYEDSLEVTEHPVEFGAQITDHSFKRPMELMLRCGWSDSSLKALAGVVSNVLGGGAVGGALGGTLSSSGTFTGGSMSASDYVAGIYSQLLQLQESRQTFSVTCGLRNYDDMVMPNLRVRRDQATQAILAVEASLRQVILVSTTTVSLPPQANQASPQSTAEVINLGNLSTQAAAAPSPGGALPPSAFVP